MVKLVNQLLFRGTNIYIYILPGEKEQHRLKSAFKRGYVSSPEGAQRERWRIIPVGKWFGSLLKGHETDHHGYQPRIRPSWDKWLYILLDALGI